MIKLFHIKSGNHERDTTTPRKRLENNVYNRITNKRQIYFHEITINIFDYKVKMKLRQKPKLLSFMEVLRFTSKAVLCLFLFGLASAIPQKASRVISQAGGGGILAQSFLREPFDQIAAVGEHVTLPCRVINKRGVLQWTRDDFGLGSERQLIGFDRYQMTGSDEEGRLM